MTKVLAVVLGLSILAAGVARAEESAIGWIVGGIFKGGVSGYKSLTGDTDNLALAKCEGNAALVDYTRKGNNFAKYEKLPDGTYLFSQNYNGFKLITYYNLGVKDIVITRYEKNGKEDHTAINILNSFDTEPGSATSFL